jgi:fumarate hydratase class II
MNTRLEKDSFGLIAVPQERLWGAQTQRSLEHFHISRERMPDEIIHALALLKRACAKVNLELGLLPAEKAGAIIRAADEVLDHQHDAEFPLSVWQTGSGTQSNMNMNEVLANRASELLGGVRGDKRLLHPNDEINLGQSSNDILPGAMHVAAALVISRGLLPALAQLRNSLAAKSAEFSDIIKIGRTHLQDAIPLTLGQEFSGYVAQLEHADSMIRAALSPLYQLAIGGTAVGTGFATHARFGQKVAAELARDTGLPLASAANKFSALSSHDELVFAHGALKALATALMKICGDIAWLASGPRCGLGELSIPQNEAGSSIMPGKVNPTQCEALRMACCQVFGNDVALTHGAAAGNFELNVYKPLIAHNLLQSIRLLADGMLSLEKFCVRGIVPNRQRIADLLQRSLMLVTALTPHIGYDKAAEIAGHAHREGLDLRASAIASGYVSAENFDLWVQAAQMLHSHG